MAGTPPTRKTCSQVGETYIGTMPSECKCRFKEGYDFRNFRSRAANNTVRQRDDADCYGEIRECCLRNPLSHLKLTQTGEKLLGLIAIYRTIEWCWVD